MSHLPARVSTLTSISVGVLAALGAAVAGYSAFGIMTMTALGLALGFTVSIGGIAFLVRRA